MCIRDSRRAARAPRSSPPGPLRPFPRTVGPALPAGESDPLAVMDQYLHPGATPVGEEVGVIGPCFAEDSYHLGEVRVHAGAHVPRGH